jgi:hypothetical protein
MRGKHYPLMKRITWLMGACGAFIIESGHAQELEPDWISARHAGMGFATAATSNDSEAGFANPAGLARMRNPRSRSMIHEIQFPRLSVIGSEGNLQQVFEELASNPEQAIESGARNARDAENAATRIESRMYPSIVFGGKSAATWLIGLTGDLRTSILHSKEQAAQTFDIKQDNTIGGVLGVAGSSRGGTFSYGVSVRPNARYFQSKTDASLDSVNTNPGPSAMSLPRTIGIGPTSGFRPSDLRYAICQRDVPHLLSILIPAKNRRSVALSEMAQPQQLKFEPWLTQWTCALASP